MACQGVPARTRSLLNHAPHSVSVVLAVLTAVALCLCLSGLTGLASAEPRPGAGVAAQTGPTDLPGGLSALDVVRQVQANRAALTGQAEPGVQPVSAGEVGPAFRMDGDTVITPAPGNQNECAVAFGGRYYLVVWQNNLTGNAICAARVDSSGLLLDPVGIAISPVTPGATFQEDPDVAFDGDNFLVVWQNYTEANNRSIYGSRVDTTGAVLDGNGFVISDEAFDQYRPSVAFDGTNYFVVWDDFRNFTDTNIYGARVTTAGGVLDADGILICSASGSQAAADVLFDGTKYFVVWADYRGSHMDIYGGRVRPNGTVLDGSGGKAISTANYNQTLPKATFDGKKYFVVWQDYRSGSYVNGDIYGARVDTTAAVLAADAGGKAICVTGNNLGRPDLIFDGTNYMVVWDDVFSSGSTYGDVYCARVDTSAVVLGSGRMPVSVGGFWPRYEPCIAFDGQKSLVLWSDNRIDYERYESDIFGARVLKDGSVIGTEDMLVSQGTNMAVNVSVAFGGNGYLVVWQDKRSGTSYDIYGVRLDLSGDVLDPAGIPISTAVEEQSTPDVAYGLGKYFVVWNDKRAEDGYSQIYGARVDTLGIVRDPDGIGIFTLSEVYCDWPSVAFDGQNYLVVWGDYRNTVDGDVYGARVDTAGTVFDPSGIAICTEAGNQSCPTLASSGSNCLVAWLDERTDDGDVYGNRVEPDGDVLDGSGLAIGVATSDQGGQAVAFDGTNYLVVWSDYRGSNLDIYGTRVTVGGNVLDPSGLLISGADGNQYYPAVAFDGTTYLVAWQDERAGNYYQDIYGARLYPNGLVIDTNGFVISAASGLQEYPVLAHGPGRAVLIGYDSFLPLPFGSMRVMGNFWPGPTPVTFLACRAEVSGGAVTLSWQVACDVPATSFLVERASSAQGDYAALNVEVTRSNGTWFSCIDRDVVPGETYWYKVSLVGLDSRETYGPVEVRVERVPAAYALYQSYPNPFNPTCFIRFDVPHSGNVTLRVFDASGRVVRTVADRWMDSGSYTEAWDGRDDSAVDAPSGVYFYELAAPDFRSTRKAVMLR